MKVAEWRETFFPEEEQSLEDLSTKSLNLLQRQAFGSLAILVGPIILPSTLSNLQTGK
jgi:hypothetical protein